jgi:hypothetical protein
LRSKYKSRSRSRDRDRERRKRRAKSPEDDTVAAVRRLLRSLPPPRLPRDAIGGRFNWSGAGELWYPCLSTGRGQAWLKESAEERATKHGEYAVIMSRLGHLGHEADLREQFRALVEPLKNLEEVILTTGLDKRRRKLLIKARERMEERITILVISRETNPEVASYFANKATVGKDRWLAEALQKYQSMQRKSGGFVTTPKGKMNVRFGQIQGAAGGGGIMSGGGAGGQVGSMGGFGGFGRGSSG